MSSITFNRPFQCKRAEPHICCYISLPTDCRALVIRRTRGFNCITSAWWFGTFFIFPYIGKNIPNWLIFFRGVETTSQYYIVLFLVSHIGYPKIDGTTTAHFAAWSSTVYIIIYIYCTNTLFIADLGWLISLISLVKLDSSSMWTRDSSHLSLSRICRLTPCCCWWKSDTCWLTICFLIVDKKKHWMASKFQIWRVAVC